MTDLNRLNKLAATRIMGWQWKEKASESGSGFGYSYCSDDDGNIFFNACSDRPSFRPRTNLNQVSMCEKEIEERGLTAEYINELDKMLDLKSLSVFENVAKLQRSDNRWLFATATAEQRLTGLCGGDV